MRTWTSLHTYQEILFDFFEGIARITINRPRYRNAFTPTTIMEISDALRTCRENPDINVVVLTGAHSPLQEGQTEEERLQLQNQINAQRGLYGVPPANGRTELVDW